MATFTVKQDYDLKYAYRIGQIFAVSIPPGYYTEMDECIREWNEVIEISTEGVSSHNRKSEIVLEKSCSFMFYPTLADVLGFKTNELYREKRTALYTADIKRGFNSLYMYCSIYEPQVVDGVYVPLLLRYL